MAANFKDYFIRQLSHRGKVYEKLNVSRSTYYRRMNDLNEMTVGDFRKLIIIGELDEQKVMDYLYGRSF